MPRTDINPVIPGFAPDPSITLIEGKFFLVTSSFHLFPGLPLFVSDSAVNWKHFGNAINRESQLKLSKSRTRTISQGDGQDPLLATGGLYAPTIRHHKGVTYIACTNAIHESADDANPKFENFIISTSDIHSNSWSDPTYFDFHGIDPDIFFDDDGRTYIVGSSYDRAPPRGNKIAIDCFEIDLQSGERLSPQREIWEGFSKIVPEGPHVYKRGPWYYLLAAEGGTTEGHRITIARSRNIWGPYEAHDQNPILDVCQDKSYIQHTGHGDLFQDLYGEWFIVCLGVRKQQGSYIMGRETFIAPVYWPEGGWPSLEPIVSNPPVLPNRTPSENLVPSPVVPNQGMDLVFIRDSGPGQIQISQPPPALVIQPLPATFTDPVGPIAFIGKHQRQLNGTATALLEETGLIEAGGLEAGLAYYRDENRFARIFWSSQKSAIAFEFVNAPRAMHNWAEFPFRPNGPTRFRIAYTEQALSFYFSDEGGPWREAGGVRTLDISGSDFIGPVIGVFGIAAPDTPPICFSTFDVDQEGP